MIMYANRRNLKKDKHCNTPPIWALWRCGQTQSSPQWRQTETHLEFTKKHLKDPQTLKNKIIWFDEPQFQASCLTETSSAHHLQSTIPKVKCAGSGPRAVELFFRSRDWGTHQNRRQVHQHIEIVLYENPVQSIQILRLGRRFTFQQDNDPKHTARVVYRQLCECPWVTQTQPGIEPNQIFLEKPENVHLPPSNLKELERWRGEEKNGR